MHKIKLEKRIYTTYEKIPMPYPVKHLPTYNDIVPFNETTFTMSLDQLILYLQIALIEEHYISSGENKCTILPQQK